MKKQQMKTLKNYMLLFNIIGAFCSCTSLVALAITGSGLATLLSAIGITIILSATTCTLALIDFEATYYVKIVTNYNRIMNDYEEVDYE